MWWDQPIGDLTGPLIVGLLTAMVLLLKRILEELQRRNAILADDDEPAEQTEGIG